MSLGFAFAGLTAGVILWIVIVRRLTVKPWELQLSASVAIADEHAQYPSAKVGLWVFLAVITSLFALFMSAYYMRMGHGHAHTSDWTPLIEPRVLWLNSAFLIASSVTMQWARASLLRGRRGHTQNALILAGVFALAFLIGQLVAWQQLEATGFFSPRNPALAFFYLLTAVHGLHLLGGLVVWTRTVWRMQRREFELIDARLSVELCAIYWHYLLLVWLVLFALLLST